MKRARIILANLHTTSRPWLVGPWLLTVATARRADAVLLQECTGRHARWLRRNSRLLGWRLIRHGGDEAILVRRKIAGPHLVIRTLKATWRGRYTGDQHKPRTIPGVLIAGWLYAISIHFPPGWLNGPDDRQAAGREYRMHLSRLVRLTLEVGPVLLGGDWNAQPHEEPLPRWRKARKLTKHGWGIDHVAVRGCRVVRRRLLGRGPGMDHRSWLYIIEEANP